MEDKYNEIESEEMRQQWDFGKDWALQRANWLEQKYGKRTDVIDKFLSEKGVKETDEELDHLITTRIKRLQKVLLFMGT